MSDPWKPRAPKWPWRDYLTQEERDTLSEAWDAKQHWLALNKERAAITNRAIQRAKYAARSAPGHTDLMISPEAIDAALEGVEIPDVIPTPEPKP